jgi:hypothetical protein
MIVIFSNLDDFNMSFKNLMKHHSRILSHYVISSKTFNQY